MHQEHGCFYRLLNYCLYRLPPLQIFSASHSDVIPYPVSGCCHRLWFQDTVSVCQAPLDAGIFAVHMEDTAFQGTGCRNGVCSQDHHVRWVEIDADDGVCGLSQLQHSLCRPYHGPRKFLNSNLFNLMILCILCEFFPEINGDFPLVFIGRRHEVQP